MSYNWQIGEEIASDKLKITGLSYLTDTGSANAYEASPQVTDGTGTNNAYSALVAGMAFTFIPANTNTGASTLDINSIGAVNIIRVDGNNVEAGDIVAGVPLMVVYDGTNFVISSPSGLSKANKDTLTGSENADSLHKHDISGQLVARTAIQTVGSSASETSALSYTIPANLLGNNGAIFVEFWFSIERNSGSPELRLKFGSSTIYLKDTTSSRGGLVRCSVFNDNDPSSQRIYIEEGSGINTFVALGTHASSSNMGDQIKYGGTESIDTTANQNIEITIGPTGAGESVTIFNAFITIYPN